MFVKHRAMRVSVAHSSSNVCQTQNYKGVFGTQLLKSLSNTELYACFWHTAPQMFVKRRTIRVSMAHSSSNVCQTQSYKGVYGAQLLKCLPNTELHIRVFMAHSYLNVCQTQSYKGVYGAKLLKFLSSAEL
jgi:hypothetical protein